MRKMKDSGIEWIGKIPEGWEVSKIGKHCTLKTGSTPPTSKEQYFDGDINWFTPMDFNGSYLLDSSDRTLSKLAIEDIAISLFPKYSILLVAIGATIGKIGYIDKEGYSNQQITAIMTKNIDYKYMLYFMSTSSKYIKDNALYTTLPIINNEYLKDIPLIIPNSFEEQSRIAGYLDKKCEEIDLVIKAKETTNEKLKEYRQSIIYETVTKGLDKNVPMKDSGIEWIGEIPEGWEVKKLKYIGESIIGITYSPDDICDEGLLVLRSSNIQNGKISYEDNVYVSKEVSEKMLVKLNDILICSRNGSKELIGKCALIDKESENSTFGAFMTVFKSEANRYIYYIFNSPIFNYHIGTFLTTTVNQLTIGNLNNIVIPIPKSETEQQQIADFLDQKCLQIDTVISANEKTIEKLKEYRQSVIYEAVTGKMEILSLISTGARQLRQGE